MPKRWNDDAELVGAISENLYAALPLLPKRLVHVEAITREFNMPFSHIQILCMLSERDMTISEISTSLGIAKPNITPLLDALHGRGLLERSRGEEDRRVVHVRLLPEGRTLAEKIRKALTTQVLEWPSSFSVSDIKRLNNALAYLIEIGREMDKIEHGV